MLSCALVMVFYYYHNIIIILSNFSLSSSSSLWFTEITSEPVVDCMERFSTSSNARLSNLAKVFLQVKVGSLICLSDFNWRGLNYLAWLKRSWKDHSFV